MKYMGSKRAMLQNGLGALLTREAASASQFVDLFSGSGAVANYVASYVPVRVVAVDVQFYSAILAGSILNRRSKLTWHTVWDQWQRRATENLNSRLIPVADRLTQVVVRAAREWCEEQQCLPITRAYGGHYFSPQQAVWIDSLRGTLPPHEPDRTVALAALIKAASQCAAAPGHTAQPFQPTKGAKPFLQEAWCKDIVVRAKVAFAALAGQFARRRGRAEVADANEAAKRLGEGDLAFVDPPYSGVHYSRFYHVLETIAQGNCGEVSGVGRYPAPELRPHSKYSVKSQSAGALDSLFKTIADRDARAIVTFPDHECSNGLSGHRVHEVAAEYFKIREYSIESKFSTLGGTGDGRKNEAGRSARQKANELVLVLTPR
ncbi:MAG: DNA adenine methylase [Acidobacteriota bacterium]